MPLLELKEVSQEYKQAKVLQDVNLTIEEGDIIGIIGQSGSGKTTLLNLLAGFLEPTKGNVLYYSRVTGKPKEVSKNLHKLKRQIGFTPQHPSFYPKLTVVENLFHFGHLYGLKHNVLKTNIKSLLEFTSLYDHRKKLAHHLSGGMQKRLDITCSLIHKPKILILDEPTADLDPILRKNVLYLLQEVNKQGVTILLASHHLYEIEQICNKVAILKDGTIHSYASLDEIKQPFQQEHFTINLLSKTNKDQIIQRLQRLPITKIIDKGHFLEIYPQDIARLIPALLQIIKEENLPLKQLDLRSLSLNEVFQKIAK